MKSQLAQIRLGLLLTAGALVLLLLVLFRSAPSAAASPSSAPSVSPAASPAASGPAQQPDPDDLEEHGIYQDEAVYIAPAPFRSVPRAAQRRTYRQAPVYTSQAYDRAVDAILSGLITEDMDSIQRCQAVYYYVKDHISYAGTSNKDSWWEAAYWGFTHGRGDYYTFYACSRALLTGLGYQVREVRREGGDLDAPHTWALVNYGSGWYHFDPCPHLKSDPLFFCFLSTDQDLMNFDAGAGRDYYAFDADAYPPRAGGRADPDALDPLPRRDGTSSEPSPAPSESPVPSQTPESSPSPSREPSPPPSPSAAPSFKPVPTARPSAPAYQAEPEPTPTPSQEPIPEPSQPPEDPVPPADSFVYA